MKVLSLLLILLPLHSAFHIHDIVTNYQDALHHHALLTKMATGGSLATAGDAIAQFTSQAPYDKKRAASFGTFDMAYRALQHVSFPFITSHCTGQLLHSAALEQTLASQLGIVPFLYYPVFFSLTGFVQGLTTQQTQQRAIENFPKLMKRNLAFWIPVQYVQFQYLPEEWQIPFLSVAGLCWTCILSLSAGSTAKYSSQPPPQVTEEPTLSATMRNVTTATVS